jgi:predicted nucleic acid-binding protein
VVLVDTCVFIDFLRGKKLPEFERLIKEGSVLLSDIVRLELTQGARANEVQKLLRTLSGFQPASLNEMTFQVAEELLFPLKQKGLTVGIPDLLIVAQSIQYRCKLYTFDRLLIKAQKNAWLKVAMLNPVAR